MPDDSEASRVPVELTGVPETLLWNLYHRAVAARGPKPLLDDPAAVDLVERLDYRFDTLDGGGAQRSAEWHAMRVRTFDAEVRRFLAARPGGTVALGERLKTQSADRSSAEWLWSNDAAVRSRLAALPGLGKRLPDFHAPVFRIDFAG